MAKLSSMKQMIEQRVCLFGPPKSGKTLLAGKLAEHYKLLVFDLENGSSVMAQIPEEWQDRVEVIKIRDSRIYPIAIETMMKVVKGDAVNICVQHSKVSCPICTKSGAAVERVCLKEIGLDTIVVIDSLTQMVNSAIAHITKNQPDDYKLQLDDWGALKVLMDKFLSQIQVAPYHVICISHEEEVSFEDGRKKIVPVGGSSNSSRNTAKYFDSVIYCNLVNKKHVVGSATDYSVSVLTGSRNNVKLEASSDPTLLNIFTNWKLDNFGMARSAGEDSIKDISDLADALAKVSEEVKLTVTEETKPLTPGQIALENLKRKQQEAKG